MKHNYRSRNEELLPIKVTKCNSARFWGSYSSVAKSASFLGWYAGSFVSDTPSQPWKL